MCELHQEQIAVSNKVPRRSGGCVQNRISGYPKDPRLGYLFFDHLYTVGQINLSLSDVIQDFPLAVRIHI